MLQDSSVPQFIIQENFVREGENNQIEQLIEQTLLFYPISFPQVEESEILQVFIQDYFGEEDKNEVNQQIEQISPHIPLFSNHFRLDERGDLEPTNFKLEVNEFFNNDRTLDSVQLVNQRVDIVGDNNQVLQASEQDIADFFLLDIALFGGEENKQIQENFDQFLNQVAGDITLDSLQFALQDTIIQGNENQVEQVIEQSIITFLIVEEDILEEVVESTEELPPTQAIIQENFFGDGESEVNGNQVTQEIHQEIILDFTFSQAPDPNQQPNTGEEADNIEFDIDRLIGTILETPLSSPQRLIQESIQTGNSNQAIQEQSQDLLFAKPQEVVFGDRANNSLEAGMKMNFDGLEDIVFTGEGNDLIEIDSPIPDTLDVPTKTRVYGGKGNDNILAKGDDRIFGGAGDDELDASLGIGNNRLYGGLGNDILLAGNNDSLNGGDGNDKLLVGGGSNNTLWGGLGVDEFWVVDAELSAQANTIVDFSLGEDQIGISGLNLTFEDIQLNQQGVNTVINLFDQQIAIILNSSADSFQSNDFIFT